MTSNVPDSAAVVRVLVADNTRMGSELIAQALRQDPRFQAAASVARAEELVPVLRDFRPDVALISAAGGNGVRGPEIARWVRGQGPQLRTILLLDEGSDQVALDAFRAGSRGVICREESIELLRKCIWSVYQGQIWASSRQLDFVLTALAKEAMPRSAVVGNGSVLLSKRESEVVRAVADGLTNRAIAAELRLSENTIKNYLFRIFAKVGVSSRSELILHVLSRRSVQ